MITYITALETFLPLILAFSGLIIFEVYINTIKQGYG